MSFTFNGRRKHFQLFLVNKVVHRWVVITYPRVSSQSFNDGGRSIIVARIACNTGQNLDKQVIYLHEM